MTCTIGGDGPRRFSGVADFQQDRVCPITQANRRGIVRQSVRKSPDNVCDTKDALKICRHCGDDQEALGWKNRTGREMEIDPAGDRPIMSFGVGSELNSSGTGGSSVGPRRRVV
jgi:hypothetical protein